MKKIQGTLHATFWTALFGILLFSFIWMGFSSFHSRMPRSGRPAELYSTETYDDLQLTYVRAINQAKKSVFLIIYSLNDKQVILALRKKAEEGIDVQIICDAKASAAAPAKLGAAVKIFPRKGKGLMHQKILATDDQQVWIGSANMTTTSLKMHGNLVSGFDSPSLAKWIRKKFETMKFAGQMKKTPVREFTIGKQKIEMWFFPDNPHGVEKIRKLIQSAKKSIRVAMFTWTRNDFAQDIADAKKRGVITEVVMDNSSTANTSNKIANMLVKSGIPVRVNTGAELLHHKFIIIDDTTLVNGSANWTYSAFAKNDDCFTVFHDLTDNQSTFLNKMWSHIIRDSIEFSITN